MKRKKKNESNVLYLITIVVVILFIILSIATFKKNNGGLKKYMKNEGYTIEENDIFYKKIVTGNSIENFYKVVSENDDADYEEYTLNKDNAEFVGLYMKNELNVQTGLSVTSNINEQKTTYNFELSYNDSHILLDGDNSSYECNVVDAKNASEETIDYYCQYIKSKIDSYNIEKQNLLNNNKINKSLRNIKGTD